MTTSAKAALLSIVSILVIGLMVHLFLPGGLPKVLDKLTTSSPEAKTPAAVVAQAAAPGDAEVAEAERAYEAGDFARAVDLFLAARADTKAVLHDRAVRGLQKAVLAWALTQRAPLPSPIPDDPDAEVARREAAAWSAPSERAWYDLTLYAAGAGSSRHVRTFVEQAVECARPGGLVEARLNEILPSAGPKGPTLREAMAAKALLAPVDPVADADASHPPVRRAPVSPSLPPAGKFKSETVAKLTQAVDLERKGKAEYDQTGPENPQRKAHRKAAYEYLKQARDIYLAAQEEDPASKDLDRHIHTVMEMISPLHKEMALGD